MGGQPSTLISTCWVREAVEPRLPVAGVHSPQNKSRVVELPKLVL